jgi:hypothetical protein
LREESADRASLIHASGNVTRTTYQIGRRRLFMGIVRSSTKESS